VIAVSLRQGRAGLNTWIGTSFWMRAGRLRTGSSERALLVNCSPDTVGVEPIFQPGHELPAPSPLTLEPSGVAVLGAASPAAVGERRDARV
jgi:hypothetical protein